MNIVHTSDKNYFRFLVEAVNDGNSMMFGSMTPQPFAIEQVIQEIGDNRLKFDCYIIRLEWHLKRLIGQMTNEQRLKFYTTTASPKIGLGPGPNIQFDTSLDIIRRLTTANIYF